MISGENSISMQYTNHTPLYYHESEKGSYGFSWHIFNGNANYRDYRGYGIFPNQSLKQQYVAHDDKATMGQIMQNQNETFRYQVQELHRLYRRQRELMDDMRMREIFMRDLQSQSSKSIPCLSQGQLDMSRASHNNASWLLGGHSESKSFALNEEKTSLNSYSGHGSVKTGDSLCCDLPNEKKSRFFIDLNEPLSSTDSCCLTEIVDHDQHNGEEAKSEPAVAKKTCVDVEYGIDLNTLPLNFPSESVAGHKNGHNSSKAKTCIDLNSYGENELEASLSPNDNGRSRRNILENVTIETQLARESIEELDRIAAETLVSIFSSAQIGMHTNNVTSEDFQNSSNSLSWFADIISSVGDDDPENKVHDRSQLVFDRTEDNSGTKPSKKPKRKALYLSHERKESGPKSQKSKRSAARDIQHPKGFKANKKTQMIEECQETGSQRRNPGDSGRKHTKPSHSEDVEKSKSSVSKRQLGTRNKQCVLYNWGKIKKRQGGCRRSKCIVATS